MSLHLVTGYAGVAHVTSADHGAFNAGMVGSGDYVLNTGMKLAASIVSNNTIRIADGDAVIQGRHVNLQSGTYEDVTIANGTQSMNRNDLIVMQYEKETSSGIENVYFAVLQGTPTSGAAEDPVPTTGNILEGDTLHEMPLYRVSLNGLTVESVTPLFDTLDSVADMVGLLDDMQAKIDEQNSKMKKWDIVVDSFAISDTAYFASADLKLYHNSALNECILAGTITTARDGQNVQRGLCVIPEEYIPAIPVRNVSNGRANNVGYYGIVSKNNTNTTVAYEFQESVPSGTTMSIYLRWVLD